MSEPAYPTAPTRLALAVRLVGLAMAGWAIALPADVPRDRIVQAIVEEIEPLYPSIKEQHFRALALDVLQYRWPCRRG